MESMILLAVLFVIMYLMLIRPESKRKKKIEAMRSGLRKGDTVITIGGIVGKLVSVDDERLVLETSEDRVRMEFVKWAIQDVVAVANKTAVQDSDPTEAAPAKKSLFGKKKAEAPVEETVAAEEPVVEAVEETTEEQK